MGDTTKNVVAQINTIIKVDHTGRKSKIDFTRVGFSYYKNQYTDYDVRYCSLEDIEQLIRDYDFEGKRGDDACFLKGIFEGGYDGEHITKNAPYLFFDIDVKDEGKKKENLILFDIEKNEAVFNLLEKWSVLAWRSRSGNGIAGILYVPQLESFLYPENDLHRLAGNAITDYLSRLIIKETGIPVKFDRAQSKLRQLRYVAKQKTQRHLNPYPLEFSFTVTEEEKKLDIDVPAYQLANGRAITGSIFNQFNQDNNILDVLLANGFSEVKGRKDRVKYYASESETSGIIHADKNLYYNYSSSFGDARFYSPCDIAIKGQFNNCKRTFAEYLRDLGYNDIKPSRETVKATKITLKQALQNTKSKEEASKIIFEHVTPLKFLNEAEKREFVKENCTDPKHKKYFDAYLGLNDLKIKYDKELFITNWISEQMANVLDYADEVDKVVVCAETGLGKSTAFLKELLALRPKSRLLFVVPLNAILDQFRQGYPGAVCLDGSSTILEHTEALNNNLVIATYEQATKLLSQTTFEYVVIDEVHNLDVAINYKNSTIASLTLQLENAKSKLIGLTGTPNAIFKELGYNLLAINKKNQQPTPIQLIYNNSKAFDIALSHASGLKANSKALILLNDIKGLQLLKEHLIQLRDYKENEILVLYSDANIKNSEDYLHIIQRGKFRDNVKIVLTTSLISEGLSIVQDGFTDVVFIESSYNPRPELIKQFFARFRNADEGRTNYLYLRKKNDQTPKYFNSLRYFKSQLDKLRELKTTSEFSEMMEHYGENSIISNESLYYENGEINKYYLANTASTILFKTLNIEQFREYLELNYNLSLDIKPFVLNIVESGEVSGRKLINTNIAKMWWNHKDEVLQAIRANTQDIGLRNRIPLNRMRITTNVLTFVGKYIKDFEQLKKRYDEVESYGEKNPDHIIIDIEKGTITSNVKYNEWLILQEVYKTVKEPQTASQKRDRKKLKSFVTTVAKKGSFTNAWMNSELRKLRIYNGKRLNENVVFSIIKAFGLEVRKCTKTKLIFVSKDAGF